MNTRNETTTTALRYMQDTKTMLTSPEAVERLALVAAGSLSPQRMLRLVAVAAMKTPKLYDVHPLSMLGALMSAASLGLEPNTPLGHCFLIPFDNRRANRVDVELVIGYKGMTQLVLNSGMVTRLSAHIHYDDDELWQWEEGFEPKLRHIPGAQEGEMKHAYAVAEGPNGFRAASVMPWAQVLKIRNNSSNWKSAVQYNKTASNPWHTAPAAMGKKTAIRNLFNMLPKASEMLLNAMDIDGGRGHAFAKLALNPEMAQDGGYIGGDEADVEAQAGDEPEREKEAAPKPVSRTRAAKPATEAKKAVEDKRAVEPDPAQEPEAQKPKPEPVKEPPPAEDEIAAEDDGPGANASEVDYSDHPVYQEVQMVIADGIPSGTIRVGMAAALNALKMTDPGAHAAIERLLDEADAASGDDGDFSEA